MAACGLLSACSHDPTGLDAGRETRPSFSIEAVDTISQPGSVTISGTALDLEGVVSVTATLRATACDPPIDTVPIIPGPEVPFSVTYPFDVVDRDTPFFVDLEARDAAGASGKRRITLVPDETRPTFYPLVPVFNPTDAAVISIAGIDNSCSPLVVSYTRGRDVLAADTVPGVDSPYPVWPLQYLFATTLEAPLGTGGTRVSLLLQDESGNGRLESRAVRRGAPITKVTGGGTHWCVLDTDGPAWCWGTNDYGELGTGRMEATLVPNPVAGGIAFRDITAAFRVTCGLTDEGELYCWGALRWDDSGFIAEPVQWSAVPVPVMPGVRVDAVAPGAGHTCALLADGSTVCWGINSSGQLGDGTTTSRSEPAGLAGEYRFSQLTSGAFHTCGLTTGEGVAYCWGSNGRGTPGTGSTTPIYESVPTAVATGIRFRTLTAGWAHTCGIGRDGFAYCWGDASGNRLGVGIGAGQVAVPTRVLIDEPAVTISVSYDTGCAIGVSRQTYCWGRSSEGQVGTPFRNPFSGGEPRPLPAAYGLPLAQIHTGNFGTCAVAENGALYCWGSADRYGREPVVRQ